MNDHHEDGMTPYVAEFNQASCITLPFCHSSIPHCLDVRRKKKLDSGDSGSIKSAGSRFKAAAKAAALSSRINPKALASKAQEATAHLTVRERGREMD